MSSTVRQRLTHAAAATLMLAVMAVLLGGCGTGRATAPTLTKPATPHGFSAVSYPAAGVKLQVPADWTRLNEKGPLVAVIASGPAVMSLWRYPRSGPALTSTAQLHGALQSLITAARAKNSTLTVARTGLSSVDSAGAVILDGYEQIAHKRRRVRSEHIYVNGAELVLDEYAPAKLFPRIDHLVFSPVRKSLVLLNGGTPAATTGATTTTPTTTTP